MTVYIVNGKPHVADTNGFRAIPTLLYHALLERGAIKHVEEVETID